MLELVISWVMSNSTLLLGAALALSEVLALIPGLASNSLFQLFVSGLKKLKEMLPGSPAAKKKRK